MNRRILLAVVAFCAAGALVAGWSLQAEPPRRTPTSSS
jgi:hypothetical protein